MNRSIVIIMILLSFGCSTTKPCAICLKPCTKYMDVYNDETKTTYSKPYQSECLTPEPDIQTVDSGPKWYDYILLPLFGIAAVVGSAESIQKDVVSSPHYQAGGSAYKDYTQPQNQP